MAPHSALLRSEAGGWGSQVLLLIILFFFFLRDKQLYVAFMSDGNNNQNDGPKQQIGCVQVFWGVQVRMPRFMFSVDFGHSQPTFSVTLNTHELDTFEFMF